MKAFLGAFLKKDGHEVWTAEDVRAATDILEGCDIDVVVSDIIMPRESGVDLLAQIHERNRGIAVIMLTGEPNVDTASDSVRLGEFDYLAKPVT